MKNMVLLGLLILGLSGTVFAQIPTQPWEQKTYQSFNYFQYTPKNSKPGKASLLLALHGCAQQAQDLATFGNFEAAAEKYSSIVVVPQVPKGSMMGCWDYYGADHTVLNHHNGILLELINHLRSAMTTLINPKKIYVAGLSSGGAQALLLACLRPDIIAGVAANSSPMIPSSMQDISKPVGAASDMAQFCHKIAAANAGFLKKQKSVILTAEKDFTVSPEHSKIIASAFAGITLAQHERKINLQHLEGKNSAGEGIEYITSDGVARVSLIVNYGVGHNWASGGEQGGGAFITQNSINFPLYFLSFFETTNTP